METSRSAEDGSELLMSTETLGCDSPVMWPDQNFFGDFDPLHLSSAPPKWLNQSLKVNDQTIAGTRQTQLMERIRALQNLAYKLGVEEAREMTRGNCLNVFKTARQPQSIKKAKHSTQ
ncbi:protein lin-52 homolog isoform X2 [Halichondria panicea]|uniref:protein lin-52 homolog isoform X2 n=1 Tax=Halichondria panicea TaxID=6063 RepID=UPI00312B4CF5